MIILGIDPGLVNTGWAIIQFQKNNNHLLDHGVVRTNNKIDLSSRLAIIFREIEKVIIKFKPQISGIEKLFINKNYKTSMDLVHARSAVLIASKLHNLFIEEYAPNKIKKTLTGNGHASKAQMQFMTNSLFQTQYMNDHQVDAIAIAYCCYINKYRFIHDKLT